LKGIISEAQWYPGGDSRAAPRLTLNVKFSSKELNALAHGSQSKTCSGMLLAEIEADAVVSYY
jgi:hypothetical protein